MSDIKKAAVLGAGVMGATIAAHLVNAGLDVVLLDLAIEKDGKKTNLADLAVKQMTKAKPSPIYVTGWLSKIKTGNFEQNLDLLKDRDWIIEVVKEDLKIKHMLFENIKGFIPEHAILTTNTSGIPIGQLSEALPEGLQKRFFGTHFFNPPRYMKLLEVIPGPQTDPESLKDFHIFGEKSLGKGVVFAKDCPNFIANRIGVLAMMSVMKNMFEQDFTIEEVDQLMGPMTGRPKSAVFRTADMVGLDTFAHVCDNLYENAPEDELREWLKIPAPVRSMIEKGMIGDKSGKGFYQKAKKADGSRDIQTIDFNSLTYRPKQKPKLPGMDIYKNMEKLQERLRAMVFAKDRMGKFLWTIFSEMLVYSVNRIGEVADDIVNIDRAMRWGFNWEIGPFETWDILGVEAVAKRLQKEERPVPQLIQDMLSTGKTCFYQRDQPEPSYFNLKDSYKPVPERPNVMILSDYKKGKDRIIKKNTGASLIDMGDGVALLEFHSKMNALGGDAVSMIVQATKIVEKDFEGMVVGNQGAQFSAGANLMLLLFEAMEGNFEDIDLMIRQFQMATTSLRYCKKPVVVAPFGLTLGGGCEVTLHGDGVQAAAETYMGLVEVGVGLIPAGGGTKEMVLRHVGGAKKRGDSDLLPAVRKVFETIGMAKVATSGPEARDFGFLTASDGITMNGDAQLIEAKNHVLGLARKGYAPPTVPTDIPVTGRPAFAALKMGLWMMKEGGYISDHDAVIGTHLARIITGGDVTPGGTMTEQHMLDLEREAFLRLCGERKSLERIQHMLQKGKPLRN